jgi:hypothetical protein
MILRKIRKLLLDSPNFIPGRPAFRIHYEAQIQQQVSADLQVFDDLLVPLQPALLALRPRVSKYEHQLARWHVTALYLYKGALMLFAAVVIIAAVWYTAHLIPASVLTAALGAGSLAVVFLIVGATLLVAALLALTLAGTGSDDWRMAYCQLKPKRASTRGPSGEQ